MAMREQRVVLRVWKLVRGAADLRVLRASWRRVFEFEIASTRRKFKMKR